MWKKISVPSAQHAVYVGVSVFKKSPEGFSYCLSFFSWYEIKGNVLNEKEVLYLISKYTKGTDVYCKQMEKKETA